MFKVRLKCIINNHNKANLLTSQYVLFQRL